MSDNVKLIDHPLIQHKLSIMRVKDTPSPMFRLLLKEISVLMGYEVLRDLPLEDVEIETPLEKMQTKMLAGKDACLVPILRAGNGFLDGMLELMPTAKVGFIGLARDPETLAAIEYYKKLPADVADRPVIVIDPMLATGGTAIATVDALKADGVKNIKFMALISVPEGIEKFHDKHSDVAVYTAAIDRELNDHGYILPGIGDAGDRIFGTQ